MPETLLFGIGQLGKEFIADDPSIIGISRSVGIDVSVKRDVDFTIYESGLGIPKIVLNCSAYTDVPGAEKDRNCWLTNQVGPRNLAEACKKSRSLLVHFSTDFVFDGEDAPYSETDDCLPLSEYGKSKLAGENEIRHILPDNHIIIRTAWLYGPNKYNFVQKIMSYLNISGSCSAPDFQIGNPTNTRNLVEATKFLIRNGHRGTFHYVDGGSASRFQFAKQIAHFYAKYYHRSIGDVTEISREEYDEKWNNVARPDDSRLKTDKIESLGFEPPYWAASLREYIKSHCLYNGIDMEDVQNQVYLSQQMQALTRRLKTK